MQTNEEEHWFVAYVRPSHERVAARTLSALGFVHWLPVQRVRRRWSDRFKIVEQLVLPHMIFVRADERGRIRSLKEVPQIPRYMFDRATGHAAFVPDAQMEVFRRMVEQSSAPVTVTEAPLAPGDMVEVINGPLAGSVCELVDFNGSKRIAVRLSMLGAALVEVPLADIRKKV